MKKVSKVICLLAAVCMVISMAACGNNSNATNGTPESSTPVGSKVNVEDSEKNNAALTTPETQSKDYSDKYVVINVGWHNSSFGDLSPFGIPGSAKINYLQQIFETLAVQTEVGQPLDEMQLVIAKSFTRVDELTLRYDIYDYVTDSKGNHIDANDVAWSFNTAKELGNITTIGCLESAEAVGEYTVEIKLNGAALGDPETMVQNIPIISKAAYEATGDGMTTDVVATGPYVRTEMVAGSTMTLVKNENYWQTDDALRSPYSKQNADEIHYQVIAENNQMVIALETGEIATSTSTKAALVSSFVDETGNPKDGYIVELNPSCKSWTLLYNGQSSSPLSNNVALRQAICYAVNPEDFIIVGQKGIANVVYDMASQQCADALEKWKDEDYYNYDVEKAAAKLEEAGYKSGELTLKILSANNDSDKLISQLLQANLAEIGINCEIVTYDTALFNTYRNSGEGWDITTDKPLGDYCPTVWNAELNKNNFTTGGTRNHFIDEELQSLLELVSTTAGHTDENLDKVHKYIMDTAYVYSFSSADDFIVANGGILKSVGYLNYGSHNVLPGCCEFTDEYLESCPSK